MSYPRPKSSVNDLPWLHGGDLIVQQLAAFGVKHLFTLTGGHISTLYDAARFTEIEIVDFRHEQAAVHAADAYARIQRDVSIAALTAGPGVTGGLTGIANAYYAESPVVTFGGRNPFQTDGAGNLQEAPQLELLRPVTKFCAAIYDCYRARDIVFDAFAAAKARRTGPAYIDLPVNVQLTQFRPEDTPSLRQAPRWSRAAPDRDAVNQVAQLLGKAKQPVILAGTGAYWDRAEESLAQFSLAAKAPIYLNGMARGLLGKSHPYQVLGSRKQALHAADFVLLLGVDLDFRLGFGQSGVFHDDATIVQVDPDASRLGKNRDVTLAIVSDIDAFIVELMRYENIFGKTKSGLWIDNLKQKDKARAFKMTAATPATPGTVHPVQFVKEVTEFLDDDATVIGDGGDIVAMFAGRFMPGGPGLWMDPGPFGCLGVGAPFAIGARILRPSSQIAVIFGDGSFGLNGFEYDSAVRQNKPFVGIMGNDGAWGEMRTFHEDMFGSSDLVAQYLSQTTAYEKVVEALGGYGERVHDASEIKPALERAFRSGVPALVNVILDPSYRHENTSVSGKQVALAYGGGNKDAFKR